MPTVYQYIFKMRYRMTPFISTSLLLCVKIRALLQILTRDQEYSFVAVSKTGALLVTLHRIQEFSGRIQLLSI